MLRWLQNHPRLLEIAYDLTGIFLSVFKRWLKPGGRIAPFLTSGERAGKQALFNCRMCGQCTLHSTGMMCPMNCPKFLRNGPCGGVRQDGHCEVIPEMPCVWAVAYERSLRMPKYGHEFAALQPPLNHRLNGSSSWINMFQGIDVDVPTGWINTQDIPVNHRAENRNAA